MTLASRGPPLCLMAMVVSQLPGVLLPSTSRVFPPPSAWVLWTVSAGPSGEGWEPVFECTAVTSQSCPGALAEDRAEPGQPPQCATVVADVPVGS